MDLATCRAIRSASVFDSDDMAKQVARATAVESQRLIEEAWQASHDLPVPPDPAKLLEAEWSEIDRPFDEGWRVDL